MKRSMILIILVAAIGLSGVFLFLGPPEEGSGGRDSAAGETAPPAVSPEQAPGPADDGAGVVTEAVEAMTDVFGPEMDAPEAGPGTGTVSGGDAVSTPVETATGFAPDEREVEADPADTMGPAANETLDAVQEDMPPGPDPGEAADGGAPGSGEEGSPASGLLPGDFDYAAALATVDAADMSALRKRSARAALRQARDDPDARPAALERVRRLLGLE